MAHKILLVEDEVNLANAILLNLKLEGYSTTHIKNGNTANFTLLSMPKNFDLVILDVMLPEKDGFDICKNFRKAGHRTPILFLSARNTAEDKVKGLRFGADDYLGKPFNLEELLLRIEILLKRNSKLTDLTFTKFNFQKNQINFNSLQVQLHNGNVIKLKLLESKLLHLLIEKKGEVVSREEIIEEVWKGETINGRSIDNIISRFRKWFETNPKNSVHFISVRGVGYKFEP